MTNLEIIEGERLLHNIDKEIELDTFQGWKRKGYSIIKGEKALFKTKIWKPRNKELKEIEEKDVTNLTEEDKIKLRKFMLVNSAFFSEKQVQKIEL